MGRKTASAKGLWKGFTIVGKDAKYKETRLSQHFHSRQARDDYYDLLMRTQSRELAEKYPNGIEKVEQ